MSQCINLEEQSVLRIYSEVRKHLLERHALTKCEQGNDDCKDISSLDLNMRKQQVFFSQCGPFLQKWNHFQFRTIRSE